MSSFSTRSRSQRQDEIASIYPWLCRSCRREVSKSSKMVICLHRVGPIRACPSQVSIPGSYPLMRDSCHSPDSNDRKHNDSVEYIGIVRNDGILKRTRSQSALSSSQDHKIHLDMRSKRRTSASMGLYLQSEMRGCSSESIVRNEGEKYEHRDVISRRNGIARNSALSSSTKSSDEIHICSTPISSERETRRKVYNGGSCSARTASGSREYRIDENRPHFEATKHQSMQSHSSSIIVSHTCANCKRIRENLPSRRIICLHNHRSIRAFPKELPSQLSSDSGDVHVRLKEDRAGRCNASENFSIGTVGGSSKLELKTQFKKKGPAGQADRELLSDGDSIMTSSMKGPCRTLNKIEISKVQKALLGKKEAEITNKSKMYGTILRTAELRQLSGARWLGDEIMNSFIALLNARNKAYFEKKCGNGSQERFQIRSCHTLSTGSLKAARQSSDSSSSLDTQISRIEFPSKPMEKNRNRITFDVQGYCSPQHKDSCDSPDVRPRTYVFSTFFAPILSKPKYVYEKVQRWLKKAGRDVLSQDLLLFPVNLNNTHWVLGKIDLKRQRFVYFDSLHRPDRAGVLALLRRWFADEVENVHGKEAVERLRLDLWQEESNPKYAPRQYDDGSCGVFVLFTAEHLERGVQPSFSQESIDTLRKRAILVLVDGQLPDY